jgi:NitT/TauT family transport system permease protein
VLAIRFGEADVMETRVHGVASWLGLVLREGFAERLPGKARVWGVNIGSVGLFVLLWQALALVLSSKYLPTPAGTVQAFVDLVRAGDIEGYTLWRHSVESLNRVIVGFGIASTMGVVLGLSMGLYPVVYSSARLVIEPVRFIPPLAWVPLAIVLLRGFWRYVFIIWLGAFFPVFVNSLLAVPKVDPDLKDMAKSFGGTRWKILRVIILPSVLPDILAGMRVGMGTSWMCIVAAEMIGGESVGLGRMILKYAELLRPNEIVVGMIMIGFIGFAINEVFLWLDRILFRWRREIVL